jgi:hypothetical protein
MMRTFRLLMSAALLSAHWATAQTTWPAKNWPSATPASVGLDAKILNAFDADIAMGKYG